MIISPAQCRAARALIGWSQAKLAEIAKVAPATIATFEAGKRLPYDRTLDDLKDALTAEGVIFLDDGALTGGGQGVRLK
ncbi:MULTISPECIES: helix-turn-helix transcriptional regulator [unclassified Phyllobacterium]|uniref:helix-turn-helix domain-containing protein n=1 Tax=Phyllobacterium TaxID=28100 RepID=UPI00087DFE51|nr:MULTISPECIES: helix-turn-helix transcriptional regulator [unclassified Phyllobacterium]MBA8901239.1 transcriptional regulator with XRE-family HTH domain [Phyllobacterium sp. P30BS-XVII]UGX87931.1 helix-turn-helix domain-containing protein [Phyllobacterium sp. T1293]SDP01194.1 Helix-turn-helix domain-containing protein [Phyllobacterium sp. OV277]